MCEESLENLNVASAGKHGISCVWVVLTRWKSQLRILCRPCTYVDLLARRQLSHCPILVLLSAKPYAVDVNAEPAASIFSLSRPGR
jgi:hypothetical protein